ncbi:MAG: PIG-L family deacetylase [Micromonosporaceae bacterium]|nr:PIG-L family deacetylase [Micromonosporaceae bacterium]
MRRALAVFAHPDDIDFGASGAVAHWVDQGIEVTYLLVTRGEAGGFDDTPREEIPRIREAEQRSAAAAVGVSDVVFLDGYADGAIYVEHRLRRDITRVIRQVRPQRVLTNSPLRRWDWLGGPNHPDHVAVGEAASSAVYPDSRNAHAHPELLHDEKLEPWSVDEVWFSGGPDPDHFVDVTDVLDRKLAALKSHVSQLADPAATEQHVLEFLKQNAQAAGFGEGRLAESFTVVSSA